MKPCKNCRKTVLYNVTILPSVVRKDFSKIPTKDIARIMGRIAELATNPRPAWSKKLTAREEYRARQGNYRILYVIEESIRVVQVTKVGNRKNVY